MKKNFFEKIKGFTLIEMLLVIAIIGILAGAVFAMIGNSDDAKTKSALSTAKSIVPYAQECLFKGNDLNSPNNAQSGGGDICNDSQTVWPGISVTECSYDIPVGSSTWVIDCSGFNVPTTISCDAQDGECIVAP